MTTKDDIYNSDFLEIGGNMIHKTAIINSNVQIGTGNRIGAFTVIGSHGEIRGTNPDEFKGIIKIGNGNVISEHVTIQTPLEAGAVTEIGHNNIIMAHAHIGHDAKIGSNTEICTTCVIGGYAEIGDGAKVKLHSVVRNRKKIGPGALIGMGSVVTKDIEPGAVVYGNPATDHKKD